MGNTMPEDALAGILRAGFIRRDLQIVNPLRIEMNLMAMALRKPFDNFSKGAFRAMAAVNKGREYGDAQVNWSLQQELRQQSGSWLGPRPRVLAGERESRERPITEN